MGLGEVALIVRRKQWAAVALRSRFVCVPLTTPRPFAAVLECSCQSHIADEVEAPYRWLPQDL